MFGVEHIQLKCERAKETLLPKRKTNRNTKTYMSVFQRMNNYTLSVDYISAGN